MTKNANKKKHKKLKLGLLIAGGAVVWAAAITIIAFVVLFSDDIAEAKETAAEIAESSTLEEYIKADNTVILDADGNEIYSVNSDTRNQTSLEYEEISEYVIDAFVAVEDQSFWTNNGYDIKGIIRVLYRYVITLGEEAHGASTITQQLARGLYLTTETTLSRKVTEIYLAKQLTAMYSKEEIITAYVNSVYFANNFYGIEAASQGYFGKSASELTLAESAFLCAIPNSPTYYDPWETPENTIVRQQKILSDMLECGYITEEEYRAALDEEIVLQTEEEYSATKTTERTYAEQTMSSYALNCAIKWQMEQDGFVFEYSWDTDDEYEAYREKYTTAYELAREEIYEAGYTIQTSLDPDAQDILQEAVDETLASSEDIDEETGRYTIQSAATCIDNETGKVIAIVGGRTQDDVYDEYNRGYQAYRQSGSSIKPVIIYTPALGILDDNGDYKWTASSYLLDIDTDDANAATSQEELESLTGSKVLLRTAVEKSTNGPALYLYARVGVYTGLSCLAQMHFDKIVPGDYTITTGLGGFTYGVTTEQMAGAYYTIYNEGYYQETTCLVAIYDSTGENLYEEAESVQVYDTYATQEMIDILEGVITSGTAKSMGWDMDWIEAAGKTGTTNNDYDHWFCGFTPYYTIAVWIGADNPETTEYCHGNTYTGGVWTTAMEALCADRESATFDLYLYDSSSDVAEDEEEAEEEGTEEETEVTTEEPETTIAVTETETTTSILYVTVPNCVGKSESAATELCENKGLIVKVVYKDAENPTGTIQVLSQSLSAGSAAQEGTTITLTVGYKEKETETETTTQETTEAETEATTSIEQESITQEAQETAGY